MREILEQRSSGGEEIIQRDDLFSNLIQGNQEGFGSGDADDDQDVSGKLSDDELMGAFYTPFLLELPFLTHPQGTSSFSSSQGMK